jgi:four helix bundle protein
LEARLHELVRGLFKWKRKKEDGKMARMQKIDLIARTKQFALQTIRFCEGLPKDETSRVLGRQLLRAGTSVGANYRAAQRAKSKPDFISKMGTVLEEADECVYWIELLIEAGKSHPTESAPLHREATELVAIAVTSLNTARRNLDRAHEH